MQNHFLQKLINIPSPILISGETGTGKSVMAKHIFSQSKIHKEVFLTVHLASLKEDLLESELFGHKRGAFTGANEAKSGYLKEVGKGTLFLDEVGELSLEAQKKLLYLLEEKRFTPVGSTHSLPFEGRIIMATNRNLLKMVEAKTFRQDLYFRMKVFEIHLMPISHNQESLKILIQDIFAELKAKFYQPHALLDASTMGVLLSAKWKGNARELKNTLEYALLMSEKNVITPASLPMFNDTETNNQSSDSFMNHFNDNYNQSLETFEKMYLETVLERNMGKVNLTAKKLGISKTTLIAKAKKYGINTLKLRAYASLSTLEQAA